MKRSYAIAGLLCLSASVSLLGMEGAPPTPPTGPPPTQPAPQPPRTPSPKKPLSQKLPAPPPPILGERDPKVAALQQRFESLEGKLLELRNKFKRMTQVSPVLGGPSGGLTEEEEEILGASL